MDLLFVFQGRCQPALVPLPVIKAGLAGSLSTARSAGEAPVSQTAESVVLFANVIRQFNAYRTSPALRDV